MVDVDPTRFRVERHASPQLAEADFQELMAEQIRHAPWVMLSIVLHGLAVLLFMLMPASALPEQPERIVKVAQMEEPEQIDEPEQIEEKVEPVETEEEVELVDPLIDEIVEDPVDDVIDDSQDPSEVAGAFDSELWNPANGLGGGAAGGDGDGGRPGRRGVGSGSSDFAPTITEALKWLRDHQDDDGKWDADEFMKHDVGESVCDGAGNPVHDIGVTGLALLAFLGDGSTLREGRFQDAVKRGVMWLRDQQDPQSGLFGTPSSNEFIYDHAIASLAMIEAYGLSEYRVLRNNAQLAINYLERHRNPYGVWRYQPRDGDNDSSVTGWCVLAYKSARDFKLEVNQTALQLSEAWFDQMTDPVSARCGYSDRGGRSSRLVGDHGLRFPAEKGECMTAVSLLCRVLLGHTPKDDPMIMRQADLILAQPPTWNEADGSIDHYYWYYGSYALFQMGGRHWKAWSRKLSDAVVNTQREDGSFDGSWDPAGVWGEHGGRVYSTALLCLTLEAYYRYDRVMR